MIEVGVARSLVSSRMGEGKVWMESLRCLLACGAAIKDADSNGVSVIFRGRGDVGVCCGHLVLVNQRLVRQNQRATGYG